MSQQAMLAVLLLGSFAHFAQSLNLDNQFIKDILEQPVLNQCDIGYVHEQTSEDRVMDIFRILPENR